MLSLISKKLSTALKVIGGVLVAGAFFAFGIFAGAKLFNKQLRTENGELKVENGKLKEEKRVSNLEITGITKILEEEPAKHYIKGENPKIIKIKKMHQEFMGDVNKFFDDVNKIFGEAVTSKCTENGFSSNSSI